MTTIKALAICQECWRDGENPPLDALVALDQAGYDIQSLERLYS